MACGRDQLGPPSGPPRTHPAWDPLGHRSPPGAPGSPWAAAGHACRPGRLRRGQGGQCWGARTRQGPWGGEGHGVAIPTGLAAACRHGRLWAWACGCARVPTAAPSPDCPRRGVNGRTKLHVPVTEGASLRAARGRSRAGTHLPQVCQLPDFCLVGGTVLSEVPGDQLLMGGAGSGLPESPAHSAGGLGP